MSKTKAILLAVLALAAAAGGKKAYDHHRMGTPFLKGTCYIMKEEGSALAIADVQKIEDQETGKQVEVYVGVVIVGPFQIPMPLDIRKTNEAIPQLVKEDKALQVNCETGEPLSK